MNKKIMIIAPIVSVIGVMIIIGAITIINQNKEIKEKEQISEIAYDAYKQKSETSRKEKDNQEEIEENDYTIYIQENERYIPYLVLTNDYEGYTLVMRKHVLDEEVPYYLDFLKRPTFEGSYLDEYLNSIYLETIEEKTREKIVNEEIIVLKFGQLPNSPNFGPVEYKIKRKVFLLSYRELGLSGGRVSIVEGEPLKYFSNKDIFFPAFRENDEWEGSIAKSREWFLRTPYYGSSGDGAFAISPYDATVTGPFGILNYSEEGNVNRGSLRPIFRLRNEEKIEKRDDIIEGKEVYVLKD